ncbi:methionyl-tRNA formyltransferase [Planctomycetota bacterium]
MRILFFGTPECAAVTLQSLIRSGHEIALVVTQPDRPSGRGKTSSPSPVKAMALTIGLETATPTSLGSPEFAGLLQRHKPDLAVVIAYGRIIPAPLLSVPQHGMLNIHFSLLPKYRGAAPIHAAICQGETETGITIFKLVPELDAGTMLVQQKTSIHPTESTGDLEARLTRMGCLAIEQAITIIDSGRAQYTEQDHSLATMAPRLQKQDGLIDWGKTPQQLIDFVRAMDPWPVAHASLYTPGDDTPMRINIYRLENADMLIPQSAAPGQVVVADRHQLVVACGGGGINIKNLQVPGKKRMDAEAFLRGNRIEMDARFRS